MPEYTKTQRKILEVGKKEFLEKGFKSASLRGIVKEAGFTQGAFYGYYPDKAALFEALVSEAADGLMDYLKSAHGAHFDLIPENCTAESHALSTQSLNTFINYIYDHFDAFKLVICCSDGTKYANYIHDLVELELSRAEESYEQERQANQRAVSPELHHMITSAYFAGVFETVAHDMSREKAIGYVNELAVFFNAGWDGVLKQH